MLGQMNSIWQHRERPIFILAPLDDVSDTVFREVVARAGAPDLMMTEFASADGFVHPKGRESVERRLKVNESERRLSVSLIAQIWGATPEHYQVMAEDLAARGDFVGIDINMGCPEKGIVKRGCCGGLIKEEHWEQAAAIIAATKKGAGKLPVSVKTRIGVDQINTVAWAEQLLRQEIAALTIHGRTVREMSRVPAHWDEIGKVAALRDKIAPDTAIIGNGDVTSRQQGEELAAHYGLDGIMIGRGVFQNLFVFADSQRDHTPAQRLRMLLEHISLYERTWGSSKSYEPLKKFFKIYVSGFPGAAELRARLMETHTPEAARTLVAATHLG
jgi:tRNA-dihydrouridine synthase